MPAVRARGASQDERARALRKSVAWATEGTLVNWVCSGVGRGWAAALVCTADSAHARLCSLLARWLLNTTSAASACRGNWS